MIRGYIAQRDAYEASMARLAISQAETYALCETDEERAALLAHWAEVNSPEAIKARAAKLARNRRRREAAERGARTIVPQHIDMGAFEAQF